MTTVLLRPTYGGGYVLLRTRSRNLTVCLHCIGGPYRIRTGAGNPNALLAPFLQNKTDLLFVGKKMKAMLVISNNNFVYISLKMSFKAH